MSFMLAIISVIINLYSIVGSIGVQISMGIKLNILAVTQNSIKVG